MTQIIYEKCIVKMMPHNYYSVVYLRILFPPLLVQGDVLEGELKDKL